MSKIVLFDTKEIAKKGSPKLVRGDVGIGLHLKEDLSISTEPGIPEHRIIASAGVVTFGVPRLLKQEQRNSQNSISAQVFNFVTQNPSWFPTNIYRPIYDVSADDALAISLLMPEHRQKLINSGTKVAALISEINEWIANRYSFVKTMRPRLLNRALQVFSYPFYELNGKTRAEVCELSLNDYIEWLTGEFDELDPAIRIYPENLRFDVLQLNERSALLMIKVDRYGADDLIVQQYFESNPEVVRVITLKRIRNTVKHFVSVYNSNLYDSSLTPYTYVDTKELNTVEKRVGGEPEWKNLKITTLGPRKGSNLTAEMIWNFTKIGT